MPGPPIFILGIHQRSGTNYVAQLLAAHPACVLRQGEDFFVANSHLLVRYFDSLYGAWPVLPERSAAERAMLRQLGHGLLAYLREDAPTSERIVTKTPSVDGLDRFFDLFPEAYLVIVVRDGRALVESHVRTFHSDWEGMTRRWRAAARAILDFDRANRGSGFRYRIVRYEDLYGAETQAAVDDLLEFLDLDRQRYPFEEIEQLPVIGSSETAERGGAHWRPVRPDPSFRPLDRWEHWTAAQHRRFNRLAGAELRAFGYRPVVEERRPILGLDQLLRDARWHARSAILAALRRAGVYHSVRHAYDRIRSRQRVQATFSEAASSGPDPGGTVAAVPPQDGDPPRR